MILYLTQRHREKAQRHTFLCAFVSLCENCYEILAQVLAISQPASDALNGRSSFFIADSFFEFKVFLNQLQGSCQQDVIF